MLLAPCQELGLVRFYMVMNSEFRFLVLRMVGLAFIPPGHVEAFLKSAPHPLVSI